MSLGMTELQIRRALLRQRAATAREILGYSCVTYAARLIGQGTKVEAAMRLAGFRNRTSFNRQFRGYLGCLPSEFRGCHVELPKAICEGSPKDEVPRDQLFAEG